MALSVSCPNCGKRFENIKPRHAGKKAKCGCGEIIRLGAKKKAKAADSDSSSVLDELMEVDLLGDELLGDQLLGGSLLGQSSGATPAGNGALSDLADPGELRSPKRDQKKQYAAVQSNGPSKFRKSKTRNRAQPKPAKTKPNSPTRPATQPAELEEPIFNQSYSDLESILEGTGNAAPIVVPPPEEYRDEDGQSEEAVASKRGGSPIGFLSALLSGTLAFWFGVFAVISKFKVIDQLLTSGFSQALHRLYTGQFGSLELRSVYQTLFSVLGWVFWTVAICLMILGAAQFLNSLFRLVTKRHFFRRIDGLTATFGALVLFLMVGWIFAQASLQRDQHKFLNEYERPATVNDQELEVVTVLRTEVDAQHRATQNWLLVGALVPMSVFVLSMTRLLTLKPDRPMSG